MTLSRGKAKVTLPPDTNVCADCSKPDPTWASMSRGVLICDECCIGHRRLGRHVSYVRSLKQPGCPQPLLTMLHQLVNANANTVWEFQILDPSTLQRSLVKRKPGPNDPQYPNKENFVKAKYQDLLFAIRPSPGSTIEDLSLQLYSSVRTNIVETSLRLLAMGAEASYRHPERGNQPIHIAAMAGQPLQVELLVIYGADPLATDNEGRTPSDIARAEGYLDLAERLNDLSYELTDRMICYLTGRRPDHRVLRTTSDLRSHHIVVPEMAMIPGTNENVLLGRSRLASLNDKLIADLAQDCYDEVDRRETDVCWQSQAKLLAQQGTVPFLPPNINLSATRNQSRQKLGLLSEKDFRTLLVELLREIRRRVRTSEGNVYPFGCDDEQFARPGSVPRGSCPTSPKPVHRSPTPKTSQITPPPLNGQLNGSKEHYKNGCPNGIENGKVNDGPTLAEVLKRLDVITNRLDRIEKCLGMDENGNITASVPLSPSKRSKKPHGHGSNAAADLHSQIFSRTSEVTRIVADLCSAVSASKTSPRTEPNSSDPTLAIAASLWTAVCGLCDLFENNSSAQAMLTDDEKSSNLLRGMADLRESASSVLTEARAFALNDDCDAPTEALSRACFSVAQATRFVLAASRQVFAQN